MNFEYQKHAKFPNQILVRNFIGIVSAVDIIDSWKYLIQNNLLTETLLGIITNLENCELKMTMDSFKAVIEFMEQTEQLTKIKLAVITNNPKQIVFPSYVETKTKEMRVKPFSTINAAVEWIMT